MVKKNTFVNSKKILKKAYKIIPSATQTFSKSPSQLPRNSYVPNFIKSGKGAWLWDVDDNKFLDYLMALGPIILGYNDKEVNRAVKRALTEGSIFSLSHYLEVELSNILVNTLENTEMVRFGKTGSDANSAAIRIARHITKKDIVLTCSYGGWHDWYIGKTIRKTGVPKATAKLTKFFNHGNIEEVYKIIKNNQGNIAAIILEPFTFKYIKYDIEFLKELRLICDKNNILLIFDEVVSGFRYNLEGATKISGVKSDLSTWGKAMANGFPLSCVTGVEKYMKEFDNIFFSGTFGGEILSIAASIATIKQLKKHKNAKELYSYNDELCNHINNIFNTNDFDQYVSLKKSGPRSILIFNSTDELINRKRKTIMMQEFIKNNILYFGINMPSYSHKKKELKKTIDTFNKVIPHLSDIFKNKKEDYYIDGPPVDAIFRKR